MKTTKTTLLRNLLAPAILLAACSPLMALDIRIGDTPARRIAKDRTLPGKGVIGECLTFAKALHKKFQAAGIPSKIVTFSYDTINFRRDAAKGTPAHAVVVYDDGGRTYSSQLQRSIGKVGKYKDRVVWERLGQAYIRNFRFTISDNVKRVLVGVTLNEFE